MLFGAVHDCLAHMREYTLLHIPCCYSIKRLIVRLIEKYFHFTDRENSTARVCWIMLEK